MFQRSGELRDDAKPFAHGVCGVARFPVSGQRIQYRFIIDCLNPNPCIILVLTEMAFRLIQGYNESTELRLSSAWDHRTDPVTAVNDGPYCLGVPWGIHQQALCVINHMTPEVDWMTGSSQTRALTSRV